MSGSGSGCCDKKKSMKRGPWTVEEDEKLFAYIQQHGHGSWRSLPSKAGLERCGKSCRLRWTNYLRPDIKRGNFSLHEDQTIIQLHALLGNRWSAIATCLPKRTDNEIKNYWNTRLKKRLAQMGIDPITHKPIYLSQSREMANTSHMAQWESARVQAEARLSGGLKFISNPRTAMAPPPMLPRPPSLDVLKVWEWSNPAASLSVEGLSPSSMLSVPMVGLFDGNSSFVTGNASSSQNHEARGIMGLDHYHHSTDYVDQEILGFPSFVDGFACHSSNAIEGWMMGSS